MKNDSSQKMLFPVLCISVVFLLGCGSPPKKEGSASLDPVVITEWQVPWEETRPRDPYVDQNNQVWFAGQNGNYLAVLNPESGDFKKYDLPEGTGPHNLIVDTDGQVWFAGNRAAYIGKLDPDTGKIKKYEMPDPEAADPHTLIFGKNREIWFTVQRGNFVGHLEMDTGRITLIPVPTALARPYGIVVDENGIPWFAEFGSHKLGMIAPLSMTVREMMLTRREARPRRLAATGNDIIWFADSAEGYLGQINTENGKIEEWRMPGGQDSRPYGMAADDQDRVWVVETGAIPNRLIGFHTRVKRFISITPIASGGGSVRHMVYHPPTQTLWFGTDTNTIGRANVP